MVKKYSEKKRERRAPRAPESVGENIFQLLESMGGNRQRSRFSELWARWEDTLGEDLAALAKPDGYKDQTLFLAAEDAMDIQELQARTDEILERVNGYLNEEYFKRIKVGLEKN